MQFTHAPSKVLVSGCSGSGKTIYWTRYLLGVPARCKFIFDHEAEFSRRLNVRPCYTAADLAAAAATPWIIFDPVRMFPGRLPEAFAFFCDFSFAASTRLPGRKIFAADELQLLVGTSQIAPELALVLETGRRYGLDCALVTQQPNLVHNRIRNQTTEVVTFQQIDPRAVDWCAEVGFDANAVRSLRPGQFLARNLKTGGMTAGRVF